MQSRKVMFVLFCASVHSTAVLLANFIIVYPHFFFSRLRKTEDYTSSFFIIFRVEGLAAIKKGNVCFILCFCALYYCVVG